MSNRTIALASRNQAKIAELSPLLEKFGFELKLLDADAPDVAETGATFAENALIKARAAAGWTGLPALADDSGLVVDALDGAPGIFSARYADDWEFLPNETRDCRNIRKLLYEMRKIPKEKRDCHFETAIAVVTPAGESLVASGKWHGTILFSPLGEHGFGYDPVFWDNERGKSAAQMERWEKNQISHRARALKDLESKWHDFAQCLG